MGIGISSDFLFQFHKCTIKTPQSSIDAQYAQNFNSIKVRLKPNLSMETPADTSFQFHKGTIKTRTTVKLLTEQYISIP